MDNSSQVVSLVEVEQLCSYLWHLRDFSTRAVLEVSTSSQKIMWYISFILSVTICAVGLVGNALVIWIAGFRMKKVKSNIWFLNLAVADLAFMICLLPWLATLYLEHWPFGTIMCMIHHLFFSVNMYVSIFILTAISIDRCISVALPLWHRKHVSRPLSFWICVALWTITFLLSVPFLIHSKVVPSSKGQQCLLFFYGNDTFNTSNIFQNGYYCLLKLENGSTNQDYPENSLTSDMLQENDVTYSLFEDSNLTSNLLHENNLTSDLIHEKSFPSRFFYENNIRKGYFQEKSPNFVFLREKNQTAAHFLNNNLTSGFFQKDNQMHGTLSERNLNSTTVHVADTTFNFTRVNTTADTTNNNSLSNHNQMHLPDITSAFSSVHNVLKGVMSTIHEYEHEYECGMFFLDIPNFEKDCHTKDWQKRIQYLVNKDELTKWHQMLSSMESVLVPFQVIGIFLPLAVILVSNFTVVLRVRRSKSGKTGKFTRLYMLIIAMVAVYFLSWMPTTVLQIMFMVAARRMDLPLMHSVVSVLPFISCLASVHSCLNPILYVLTGKKVKVELGKSISSIWQSIHTSSQESAHPSDAKTNMTV